MPLIVTHRRVSAIADDPTHPEEIQPSEWGSTASVLPTHVVTGSLALADAATVLATPRTINGVAFDGSGNIVLPAPDLSGLVLTSDARLSDARVPLAHVHAFGTLTGIPTSLAGYGILDAVVLTGDARLSDARVPLAHTHAFADLTSKPTSLAGYGILDAIVLGTRTVNGHALSADVTVTKADLGLGNVENTALSTGNAGTATLAAAATVLQTARTINGVAFDGSGNITVPAAAGTLTGATLAASVLASSLTSVGVLATLTVTAAIVGSVTGAAGSVAASALTGATLAAGVLASSLTSLGLIASLSATKIALGDGTALLPSISFATEATLGFWRSSAGVITVVGALNSTGSLTGVNLSINGGQLQFLTKGRIATVADGQFNLTNIGQTAGAGFDVVTDAILKVRTRAQTGYATVDALGYRASGVAGISFGPAHPASITIVNGIVTACS